MELLRWPVPLSASQPSGHHNPWHWSQYPGIQFYVESELDRRPYWGIEIDLSIVPTLEPREEGVLFLLLSLFWSCFG
jgi:hypothetical protein